MARYKEYDMTQSRLVPLDMTKQLEPGTLEYTINEMIEERVSYDLFEYKYKNDDTGRKAYDPKMLLKIILFAYSRGILSSRQIERACQENITFMALAGCQEPDHSTISSFVSTMGEELIKEVFTEVILYCNELKLLGGSHFSLDGVKMASNASKEKSGKFEELMKKRDKLEIKVEEAIREHKSSDKNPEIESSRAKRIHRLKTQVEQLDIYLKKKVRRIGGGNKEIKANVTDPESALMKTSHGYLQGYNAQALVDSKYQVITYAEASSEGQDYRQLITVLPGAKEVSGMAGLGEGYYKGKVFTADCSYHSQANLEVCEEEKLDAYIPDSQFRKRDIRFSNRDKYKPKANPKECFGLDDFNYDARADKYICKNGKELTSCSHGHKIRNTIYKRYQAKAEDCKPCKLNGQCFVNGGKRKMLAVPIGGVNNLRDEMIKKIDTKRGREIYSKRLAIVEPCFANIEYHKKMNRFTLRGKKKVNVQWNLYCIVHNLGKITNFKGAA